MVDIKRIGILNHFSRVLRDCESPQLHIQRILGLELIDAQIVGIVPFDRADLEAEGDRETWDAHQGGCTAGYWANQ